MRIQVNGKQIDVGESLTTHVDTRLNDVVNKYSERPVDCLLYTSPSPRDS